MYLKITYIKIIILFIILLLFVHSYSILPYHTQKFNNIFNSIKSKLIIENYVEDPVNAGLSETTPAVDPVKAGLSGTASAVDNDNVVDTFKWFFLFGRDLVFNVIPNYTWITRYYDKKNDWVRANKGLPPLLPSLLPEGSKVNVTINREDSDFKLGSSGRSIMNMML